jgi:hypothetical protein
MPILYIEERPTGTDETLLSTPKQGKNTITG